MNITVILSGGSGERFGSDKPKQYHLLNGKEVISYVYDAVKRSTKNDKIIIVSAEPLEYVAEYVSNGATHNQSVNNALNYIRTSCPSVNNVLFLDAARPFVKTEMLDRYFDLLQEHDAVITVKPITDSLGKEGTQFVDRSNYFLIQKPEAFRFEKLINCFSADSPRTAIVQQLPSEAQVYNYYDIGINMKITYPEDLLIAELLIENMR